MGEQKHQIIDANEARGKAKGKRKSPAQLILESLEGDYKTFREVAAIIGCHTETLRRLCRATNADGTKKIAAPSQAVRSGEMTIYLFTEDDLIEVQEYFEAKGYVINT